jgi:hypothetical protein
MEHPCNKVAQVGAEVFNRSPPGLSILRMNQLLLLKELQNFRHLFQASIHLEELIVKNGFHKNANRHLFNILNTLSVNSARENECGKNSSTKNTGSPRGVDASGFCQEAGHLTGITGSLEKLAAKRYVVHARKDQPRFTHHAVTAIGRRGLPSPKVITEISLEDTPLWRSSLSVVSSLHLGRPTNT